MQNFENKYNPNKLKDAYNNSLETPLFSECLEYARQYRGLRQERKEEKTFGRI